MATVDRVNELTQDRIFVMSYSLVGSHAEFAQQVWKHRGEVYRGMWRVEPFLSTSRTIAVFPCAKWRNLFVLKHSEHYVTDTLPLGFVELFEPMEVWVT